MNTDIKPHPLKEVFKAKGISQVKICKLLGKYHQSQVCNWLNGYDIPKEAERALYDLSSRIEGQK